MTWDEEAYVWLASSKDVPALALEAGSIDALMERVKYAVPDLLDIKTRTLKSTSRLSDWPRFMFNGGV